VVNMKPIFQRNFTVTTKTPLFDIELVYILLSKNAFGFKHSRASILCRESVGFWEILSTLESPAFHQDSVLGIVIT